MRGTLKRKFAEVDDNPCYSSFSSSSSSPQSSLSSPASSEWESDGESVPSDSPDFPPHSPSSPTSSPIRSILKRRELGGSRGNVRFDQVTVFSFPRCQGFTSVPSHGGATLGMMRRHVHLQRYTLADHALEQRRRRRERLRERRREERIEALKHKLITVGGVVQMEAESFMVDQLQDEDADAQMGDSDLEDGGFPQPFSSRQRQVLLQAAGVKRIDREEKRQLHALRRSREACGCDCRGFCEPETCACSQAGIRCQVDRFNFPCGCTQDSCGNTEGRIEFNSKRVQTHYIHTAMRLELERRLQDETMCQTDRAEPPEELRTYQDRDDMQKEPVKICPFGFMADEDSLPLTMPVTTSFHLIPERLAVEENSCSSDMTESSCSSSDSDAGGCPSESPSLAEVDGLSRVLSICDNDSYSVCSQLRPRGGSSAADGAGPPDAFTDHSNRESATDYLDENANQARDLFEEDSLEDFPNTPSPTVDYTSGRYMDLSLSSDSDLEFFDCDYTSGPLHSSFKLPRHPDNFCHLQLFRSVNLPEHESSTYLLESLIGLTEPSPEEGYTASDSRIL